MATASPFPSNLRNVPVQTRSRERLSRVLEAAADVLACEGAEALSTKRVAEEAGVAIGSVYRLFGDKEAIAEALAVDAWERFAASVAAVAAADERAPLDDPLGAILAVLREGLSDAGGFRELWYSPLRTQRLRDATRPTRHDFSRSVARILAVHWPDTDPALRQEAAGMVVLTGDGLLREAFRLDPAGDTATLAESRLLLDAYLDRKLG